MKKLSKISLHNLSQAELAKREENLLKGGKSCACIGACLCMYAGDKEGDNDSFYGGSSSDDNNYTNAVQNGNENSN